MPMFDERPPWQDLAACLGCDPELFFPPPKTIATQAKAVCQGCEVRAECLAYAIETHQKHGIWGGLAPKERRRLRVRSA